MIGESFLTSDEEHDSDDEIPLGQLRSQPTAETILSVASNSNNGPPKWKKVYTILAPDDYTPIFDLPDEISS